MDIKGVFRSVIPSIGRTEEAKAHQKSDANNDREGNGQAATGGEQQQRRAPTPEEIVDAVKYLEGLPGIKDNGLVIRVRSADGMNVIYVEDRNGKVVRRIPESEIAYLASNRQKKTGNLLNRAM